MISVIMPVYKAEKYLDRAITSVLGQIHTDFELLLVDDGSPDNSGQICDQWAEKDSRIKVFHTENHGVSAARNTGIMAASGDYIAFIDSDDFVKPEWLSNMYSVAVRTNADIVKSGLLCFSENNADKNSDKYGFNVNNISTTRFENSQVSPHKFHQLLVDNYYYSVVWNQLVKAEIQKKCPFAVGKYSEDYLVYFSILEYAQNIQITDSTCYCYGKHEDSITNTAEGPFMYDLVEHLSEHSKIFISKYNDKKYAAKTLHRAMQLFFYYLTSTTHINDVDYNRIADVWPHLLEACKLNDVKHIVPFPLFVQYCLCKISLPSYLKLVKLKKAIFNNG